MSGSQSRTLWLQDVEAADRRSARDSEEGMPARINHNVVLRQIHRSMALHGAGVARQIEQLSSGNRVNRSSDDPASLALANGIQSEVRAIAEGTRNIQQTFALLQVAEGSLSEIANMIGRMRDLAMQASSSVYNDVDRQSINSEFNALRAEIDRIAAASEYNGRHLLTGSDMTVNRASTALTGATASGISDIRVSDAVSGTYTFVDAPGDGQITLGNGILTQTISVDDRLVDGAVSTGTHAVVPFDRLGIRITLNGPEVLGAPGEYVDGALDGQTIIVDEITGFTFQFGPSETSNDVAVIHLADMRATGPHLGMADLSFVTVRDAQLSLERLAEIQQKVTVERNRLGAFQNRLELSVDTSMSVVERMLGTEAEIREVDLAKSVSEMTKSQILSQVAVRMALEVDADIGRMLSLLQ